MNKKFSSIFFKSLRLTTPVIIFVLILLPIINIIFILTTNGSNSISNDTLLIAPLIDRMLNGAYQWRNYFHDVFQNGHFQFFTILIHLSVARFANWNYFVLLSIGISLAIIRLILLYSAFTISKHSWFKFILLIFLSSLVFSVSQISTFEFDWNVVMVNLCLTAFILGVWALKKFPGRWLGFWIMIVGGWLANWSSGSGPLVWVAYLFGLVIFNYRRVVQYFLFFALAILISWPYFYYLALDPVYEPYGSFTAKLNFFKPSFILQSIGFPLAQEFLFKPAFLRGLIGLILCFFGLVLIIRKKPDSAFLQKTAAPLMVLIFSLLNIWQISVVRDFLLPWYASYFMLFWIALVGLAYLVWELGYSADYVGKGNKKNIPTLGAIWSVLVFLVVAFFYLTSNISFSDKSFFLQSRSPSSVSCLRNYKTAPTYCEHTLFAWTLEKYDEFPKMAEKLERNHLSVFAPRQRWTLQGDYFLGKVQFINVPKIPEIFWSKDSTNNPFPFKTYQPLSFPFPTYRHLNLFLHSPNWVEWTVSLPPQTKNAVFHSAIAISPSAPLEAVSDGVWFEINIEGKENKSQNVFTRYVKPERREWEEVKISLKEYAGQTIKIRLGSESGENYIHDWAMYRYPYIDLLLDPNVEIPAEDKAILPQNTDLSPDMAKPTPKDFNFEVTNPKLWRVSGLVPVNLSKDYVDTWVAHRDPILEYNAPLDICLSDYAFIYIKLAASPNWATRDMQIFYKLNDQTGFDEARSVAIPIIGDGKIHEYTFDLKILEPRSDIRLKGIRLDPVMNSVPKRDNKVKVLDFRLIKHDGPSQCV